MNSHKQRFHGPDILRGVAATLVVIVHMSYLSLVYMIAFLSYTYIEKVGMRYGKYVINKYLKEVSNVR